jgi:hypothetical protein
MIRILAALVLMSALSGCREIQEDQFVEISGRIFVFNYRVAIASYVVTLGRLRQLPDGASLRTAFDDPAGGAPIVVRQKVWPGLDKIAIESPPLFCIVKDKPYKFIIELETADGKVLQRLESEVVSNLDQSAMPDRPLVAGPAYDPNPELKGRADGKLPGQELVKCKL